MTEALGPHLLGRVPSPPDERDFKLSNFTAIGDVEMGTVDPYDLISIAEQELKLTTVTFKKWAATSYPDVTKTHWFKAFNALTQAKENLGPPPPPPSGGFVEWDNPQPILDQMDTNHCVGFSGAQWGNTLPINDLYTNRDAHAIYYETKVFDGEPNEENGSTMRSLAKALKARGRLTVYAFAETIDEAIEWIKTKGPVMVGTDWLDNMFDADANGLVSATGPTVGGHAYLINGYDAELDQLLYINSWGTNWANDGHFRMSASDAEMLHEELGELLVAVELPLG
jgi:hypothetical protein